MLIAIILLLLLSLKIDKKYVVLQLMGYNLNNTFYLKRLN